MDKEHVEVELKLLSSPRILLHRITTEGESNSKSEADVRIDHPHYSYSAPFEFNQFNTLSMYWKMYVVDQFRRQYEFETGIAFDAVIRIRPDLVLHEPLSLDELSLDRPDVVHLPWFNSSMRLAFDQLAVGPPEAMRTYAKAYYNVPYLTESSALTLGFHPEHTLFMHLKDSGLSLARIHSSTSIARCAGEGVEHVDSFARLRSEFGSAALSCEEEFSAAQYAHRGAISQPGPHARSHPSSPTALNASSPASAETLAMLRSPSALAPIERRLAALENVATHELQSVRDELARLKAELSNESTRRESAERQLDLSQQQVAQIGRLCFALAAGATCCGCATLVARALTHK